MNHSIYVSGNPEVLENMKKQGIKARHFARSDDYLYTGTKIRENMLKRITTCNYNQNYQCTAAEGTTCNKAEMPCPFQII
jgi:hypothetical protein